MKKRFLTYLLLACLCLPTSLLAEDHIIVGPDGAILNSENESGETEVQNLFDPSKAIQDLLNSAFEAKLEADLKPIEGESPLGGPNIFKVQGKLIQDLKDQKTTLRFDGKKTDDSMRKSNFVEENGLFGTTIKEILALTKNQTPDNVLGTYTYEIQHDLGKYLIQVTTDEGEINTLTFVPIYNSSIYDLDNPLLFRTFEIKDIKEVK